MGTIIPFPVERRLTPEAAQLVEIAAKRAEGMGHPCDRRALAVMLQEWRATETAGEAALLEKARAAIAQLPPREPR